MSEQKNKNLVWIDLEMTGLNPERDCILEIASLVTDSQLRIIAEGPSCVISHAQGSLPFMSEWVEKQHSNSGLLSEVFCSTITISKAEQDTLAFLDEYCDRETAPLCGNSVWQDRSFLRVAMPRLIDFLHYRIIDVTSIKELVNRWYCHDQHAIFKKKDRHRAMDDIRESVEELRYYRDLFFKTPPVP